MAADGELGAWLDSTNAEYEKLHLAFENDFWSTKMALKGASTDSLTATKSALDKFLRDKDNLAKARTWQSSGKGSDDQKKVLNCLARCFGCYSMSDPAAEALADDITAAEGVLAERRNTLKLGYTPPAGGAFKEMSSVGLRNTMKTAADESERKAAYDGLRAIGPFVVANGFLEIVKKRNQLARKLGFIDYYDYKVTAAEGFGKTALFEILDGLEQRTRPQMVKAREALAAAKGADALQPWNTSYAMAGDIEKQLDPYFPFEKAVEAWGRTFTALGIQYKGATMTLDLLDRKGKYSNGFCHWPQPAWVKPDGQWVASKTNFTSLADPAAVGSGKTGLTTLLHEGGHAAHFANIVQPSPLFSQERAPTSIAYAENQSMFLDSLLGDAAWMGRYARSRDGQPVPWSLVEQNIRATHPYDVMPLRGMLAVPYFEKGLYELAEDELTADNVLALADRIELDIQGGLSPRPMMSVPHILADESSCYYHGYVLAEMSVHQTREHFLKGGKRIVDNPEVGKQLTDVYWRPGNSEMFLDLVQRLTGKPLTGDAWVAALEQSVEAKVTEEHADYDWAVSTENPYNNTAPSSINLDMRMLLADGDAVIADSSSDGGFLPACKKFEAYVQQLKAAAA